MYFNLGVCVCLCACAESEADMLYLSRIRAATHAGCHRQRHRQQQRPRLHSEPALAVVCTCWPALASLGWNMENLSKLITHTSAATLWTLRLAARDTCHLPHATHRIPVALRLPSVLAPNLAGGQLIQRPRSPSVIADTGAH